MRITSRTKHHNNEWISVYTDGNQTVDAFARYIAGVYSRATGRTMKEEDQTGLMRTLPRGSSERDYLVGQEGNPARFHIPGSRNGRRHFRILKHTASRADIQTLYDALR